MDPEKDLVQPELWSDNTNLVSTYFQEKLQQISIKYEELQKLFDESNAKMVELTKPMECDCKQSNEVSLAQLNADIASDKVAAQRATEQNKKLKQDLQGLEEAVLKMVGMRLQCANMVDYLLSYFFGEYVT